MTSLNLYCLPLPTFNRRHNRLALPHLHACLHAWVALQLLAIVHAFIIIIDNLCHVLIIPFTNHKLDFTATGYNCIKCLAGDSIVELERMSNQIISKK